MICRITQLKPTEGGRGLIRMWADSLVPHLALIKFAYCAHQATRQILALSQVTIQSIVNKRISWATQFWQGASAVVRLDSCRSISQSHCCALRDNLATPTRTFYAGASYSSFFSSFGNSNRLKILSAIRHFFSIHYYALRCLHLCPGPDNGGGPENYKPKQSQERIQIISFA